MVTATGSAAKLLSQAKITAIGSYVPEKVLTNHDLELLVDTNDEWIVQRTGMKERRIAADDEYTSDLAFAAVRNMIERYQITVEDVDLVLVCTTTPDQPFPSVAAKVQAHFGMTHAGAMDLSAACAGFVYGLQVANGLITAGAHHKVLVIGAETLSKVTDYADRSTCILFGDGAGAVLVERDAGQPGFLASFAKAEGQGGIHVYASGISKQIDGKPLLGDGRIVQNGREVYKWAVTTIPDGMKSLLQDSGYELNDVDWFVPHSANLRIIDSICERVGFPLEKTLYSLVHYGNTSAATIPLSIDLGVREGKLKPGDLMLLYGFGSGLVQAGLLLRWAI